MVELNLMIWFSCVLFVFLTIEGGRCNHYKISRLGKIHTVDPLVGIFDPKMVFFRLRKSQESKEKHLCFQFGGRASADYL